MERKMFGHRLRKKGSFENDELDNSGGRVVDAPKVYEGKEHVKYKNPGFFKHHIRYPEDEPHMKSHASKEEMHEMEDDYHMDVPNQTEESLEKKIKRARMKMDAPDHDEPKALLGQIVHNVGYEGEEDTSGEEEEGPNYMQEDEHDHEMPKEHRKRMIISVMKRKRQKRGY